MSRILHKICEWGSRGNVSDDLNFGMDLLAINHDSEQFKQEKFEIIKTQMKWNFLSFLFFVIIFKLKQFPFLLKLINFYFFFVFFSESFCWFFEWFIGFSRVFFLGSFWIVFKLNQVRNFLEEFSKSKEISKDQVRILHFYFFYKFLIHHHSPLFLQQKPTKSITKNYLPQNPINRLSSNQKKKSRKKKNFFD
jgi:hypothetical protein